MYDIVWVYFKLPTLTGATWTLTFVAFFTEVDVPYMGVLYIVGVWCRCRVLRRPWTLSSSQPRWMYCMWVYCTLWVFGIGVGCYVALDFVVFFIEVGALQSTWSVQSGCRVYYGFRL